MRKKKFKKKSVEHSLLRSIKKERRKSYMELPIIKWYGALFFCTIGCFWISYFLFKFLCLEWWASLLQSCGAGVLTGMIVFVLGNVRSQAKENIVIKVEQLSNLYKILEKVYDSLPDRALLSVNKESCNYSKCTYMTINAEIEYVEEIKKLDYTILKKFINKIDFDFQEKQKKLVTLIEQIDSKELSYSEARRIRNEVIVIIHDASIWFEEQLNRAEMRKQQIRTYPF